VTLKVYLILSVTNDTLVVMMTSLVWSFAWDR